MSLLHTLQTLGFENLKPQYREDGWVTFSCPIAPYKAEHGFSADKSPSAGAVKSDDGEVYWNCFCCKSKGKLTTLLGYLGNKTGKDYSKQIESLREGLPPKTLDDFAYTPPKPKYENKEIPAYVWGKLFSPVSDKETSDYLSSRGISSNTANKLGLVYDLENKSVVFPFIRDSKVYGYAARFVDKAAKPRMKYSLFNSHYFLLGEHLWEDKPTIIVEGLFAYAKLHELGFSDAYDIGALGGSSIHEKQAQILWGKAKPVILFLDGDAPGISGTLRCEDMLKTEVLTYKVSYPDDKNDIDILTKEEINDILEKAVNGNVNKKV